MSGFTLIELVVVVAIIGILAAIAYPSYQDSVRKSKRADAKSALLELAQWMERNYTLTNQYNRAVGDSTDQTTAQMTSKLPFNQSPRDSTKAYDLSVSAVTNNGFQIDATPAGTQASDPCKTLTLTHTGAKGVAGGAMSTAAECWR
ncbi:MAG: prepilin-type N-terminal cleavage/methylation domain-containing protein [Candidatus Competibacteraceae bacterium]|nr:prepilin-type N-terminal cleavage/methylation domain-containing protein [Candidatus Competibacteraceae bacterium]